MPWSISFNGSGLCWRGDRWERATPVALLLDVATSHEAPRSGALPAVIWRGDRWERATPVALILDVATSHEAPRSGALPAVMSPWSGALRQFLSFCAPLWPR